MTATMVSPTCRFSFPSLFKKERKPDGSEPDKYAVTGLFTPADFSPEDKVRWKQMLKAADELAIEKFKKPVKKFGQGFRSPFNDGADKDNYAGYGEGVVFVKFTSKMRPGVVASDTTTPIEDEEAIYAGAYGRISCNVFAYDNVSKGVAFGLRNVMFVKDGDRLDNRTTPEEDFENFGSAETQGSDPDDGEYKLD